MSKFKHNGIVINFLQNSLSLAYKKMEKRITLLSIILLIGIASIASTKNREEIETKYKSFKKVETQFLKLNQKQDNSPELKSVTAKNLMLEKITIADGSYKEFKYNDKGQTIGYKHYKFNEETNTTPLTSDNTFTYDASGNRVLQSFKSLVNNALSIVEKDEFTYDANNRETLHILSTYDMELEKLIPTTKTITSYKTDGYLTEVYSWSEAAQTWNLESKTELETKNGIPVKGTFYSKNEETGIVEKSMIVEYTLNSKGLLIKTLMKAVDEASGQMVDFMKSEITYNDRNYEISSVESMFDSESGTWMEWSKSISNYNSNYVLTYDEGYQLDWLTFQLALSEKHEYSYTDNQLSQELIWQNEGMMGELSQTMKFEYTYDNSINIEAVVLPDSWIEHNDEYNDIESEFVYYFGTISNVKWFSRNYETESLQQYRDATYHYSNFGGGVAAENISTSSVKVGPNPFDESITFSQIENTTSQISIYNVSGQKVYDTLSKGTKTINTSTWQPGIYIIHVNSGNTSQPVKKIIKR